LWEGGVLEGAKPPLYNLFPLSKSGEGDKGGEVDKQFNERKILLNGM
jgi:hypothetical protein